MFSYPLWCNEDKENVIMHSPAKYISTELKMDMTTTDVHSGSLFSKMEIDLSDFSKERNKFSKWLLPKINYDSDTDSSDGDPEYYFSSEESEDEHPKYSGVAQTMAWLASKMEQISLASPMYEETTEYDEEFSTSLKRKLDISDILNSDQDLKSKKNRIYFSPPPPLYKNNYIEDNMFWNSMNTRIRKKHARERSSSLDSLSSISSKNDKNDSYSMKKEERKKCKRTRSRSPHKNSARDKKSWADIFFDFEKEAGRERRRSSSTYDSQSKRSSRYSYEGRTFSPKKEKCQGTEYFLKNDSRSQCKRSSKHRTKNRSLSPKKTIHNETKCLHKNDLSRKILQPKNGLNIKEVEIIKMKKEGGASCINIKKVHVDRPRVEDLKRVISPKISVAKKEIGRSEERRVDYTRREVVRYEDRSVDIKQEKADAYEESRTDDSKLDQKLRLYDMNQEPRRYEERRVGNAKRETGKYESRRLGHTKHESGHNEKRSEDDVTIKRERCYENENTSLQKSKETDKKIDVPSRKKIKTKSFD